MTTAERRQVRDLAGEIAWREDVAERMASLAEPPTPATGGRTPQGRMADTIAAGLELMPIDHQLEVAEWIRMHLITQLGALKLPTSRANT